MFLLLIAIGLFTAFVIGAAFKRRDYWKERGVKGPDPSLFLGNLDVLGNPVDTQQPSVYYKWSQENGPVYGILRGWMPALVVSTHELASEVLHERFEEFHGRDLAPVFGNEDYEAVVHVFLTRGKRWRRLRAINSTAFSSKSLKSMFEQLSSCSSTFIENLEMDVHERGNRIDIKENFYEYTADVLFRLVYGRHESRAFLQDFIPSIHKMRLVPASFAQQASWIVPHAWRLWKFLQVATLVPKTFKIFRFIFALKKTIQARKEERTKNPGESPTNTDFMNIYLDYESNDVKLEDNQLYDKRSDKIVKALNSQEVLGATFMLMFAGFDTVASTASFIIYYLATHEKVQEKLRGEIEEICGLDQDPSFEQLQSLKYLDAVLKETLRLQPIAASVTSRKAACDTQLAGIPIEQDTHILIDVISIHKDPSLWGPDAEDFRPERWLGDDAAKLMTHFYAFGNGPRICVGMKLAYAEIRLVIVKLLQRYRIKPTPQINKAMQISGIVANPKSVPVLLEQI